MSRILFVGLHDHIVFLSDQLSTEGHLAKPAPDIRQAVDHLSRETFDVVVVGGSPSESERNILMSHLSEIDGDTRCIILPDSDGVDTDFFQDQSQVECIPESSDAGACLAFINKVLSDKGKNGVKAKSRVPSPSPFFFYDFIGESEAIRKISSMVERVASTDSTVLITGESGTGKELIARAIHKNSGRRDSAMIIINCGSIPGELLESELFGHEKGAFTGAHRTRIGRFELANGGTIFLDEIGDMSPDLQVKLLRVLQEKCFERVGGARSIHVDVRIISATNKDLKKAIQENTFREDLFYRLNVIPITVPPLRQRKSDIPFLVDYFIRKLHEKNRWGMKHFSDQAMAALCRYEWTGNVRELENLMERISVLVEKETIDLEDLPEYISGIEDVHDDSEMPLLGFFENGMGFNEAVEEHQKKLILHALTKTNWVKAKAAEMLKMKRTTLVEKIKKMNLLPPNLEGWDDDALD
ncbi:MAG: sigma-54 dependent transcriptional regulator [Desulfobacteraceae bacterium]|nr:sigma-54 dependent transcriptional regulator [Desulfobacteraceae bacterium]